MRVFTLFCLAVAVACGSARAAVVRLGCPLRLTHCTDYRANVCADFSRVSFAGLRLDADHRFVYLPTAYRLRETAIEYTWGTSADNWVLSRTTMHLRHSVYIDQTNVAFVAEWSGICRVTP